MPDPDKDILEGEILQPGEAYQAHEERAAFRVIALSGWQKLLVGLAAIGFVLLALFLSFWIAVLSLPLIAAAALFSWLMRRLR